MRLSDRSSRSRSRGLSQSRPSRTGAARTVTVKVPVDTMPRSFVLQVTVVVPTTNADPDAGVQVTGRIAPETLRAVAVNVTGVVVPLAMTTTFAGSRSWGGVIGVTVNVELASCPRPSTAVQSTVVLTSETKRYVNVAGEAAVAPGGVQVSGTAPPHGLRAPAVKVTIVEIGVAGTTRSRGTVTTGGPARTVTTNDPNAVLPVRSDAEHRTVVAPIGNVVPDTGRQLTGTLPSITSKAEAA